LIPQGFSPNWREKRPCRINTLIEFSQLISIPVARVRPRRHDEDRVVIAMNSGRSAASPTVVEERGSFWPIASLCPSTGGGDDERTRRPAEL
jgi:hypothetical protein